MYNLAQKAVLAVSFGTTYPETRKLNIESVENGIRTAFPGYEVRRAFTSRIVIKKLAERDGILVDTERQALERLAGEGFAEVIVQPLHVVAGEEYEKVKSAVQSHAERKTFGKITLGRPLLYYLGQEDKGDDYMIAIKALERQLPGLGRDDAVVLMGHGGVHPANAAYAALRSKLIDAGRMNAFVYTVEGYPSFDDVVNQLKKNGVRQVTLIPFMLVAGDHAVNDMAGDEKESAKSKLAMEGFRVSAYIHGLGENPAIRDIYVQHAKDAASIG